MLILNLGLWSEETIVMLILFCFYISVVSVQWKCFLYLFVFAVELLINTSE